MISLVCRDVMVAAFSAMSLMSRDVAVAMSPLMAKPAGHRGRDVPGDEWGILADALDVTLQRLG
eukprot:12422308-Karenia_brevis.AAC.1